MKTFKNLKYLGLVALAISFTACNDEADFEEFLATQPESSVTLPALTAGSADFSNYVALGASFTAGYTDGALFKAAQENSFPNLLSQRFSSVGGGAFTQPLMNDNTGGMIIPIPSVPDLEYRLVFNGSGPQRLDAFFADLGAPAPPVTTNAGVNLGSRFNNVGVPGAKSFHMTVPGYGSLNPYFGRFATSAGASMLGETIAQGPSFFTLSEVGGNDVLSYATSGGVGVDQTGNFNPATYGTNDITDPTVFGQVYNGIVSQLVNTGAQGVLANLPYITDLPYFTTVPHNPVPLDAATAAQLNAGYGMYNGGIVQAYAFLVANTPLTQEMADAEIAKRTISFNAGEGNALVIIDEDLRDLTALNPQLINLRQATASDIITLPTSTAIPGGAGTAAPLGDVSVLTPEEQLAIKTATDAYNQVISDAATTHNLPLVDFKGILQQASTVGIENGDYILNTNLVTGGLVSLDGIHLTAQGYAIMANEFMRAIDAKYGSNFEASGSLFEVVNYPTNYSPLLQ
jgi:lysophospholipase L1-like esterase